MAIFGEKLLTSACRYQEACAFVSANWGDRADLGEKEYLEKVQEKLADEEPMHLPASMQKNSHKEEITSWIKVQHKTHI